jgi:phosphoribosylcarboxyaminoimidazole (NCAIR) mutase
MQWRAIADLEIHGNELRSLRTLNQNAGVPIEDGVVRCLLSLSRNLLERCTDKLRAFAVVEQALREAEQLVAELIVLLGGVAAHIASIVQSHQHPVGGAPVGFDSVGNVGNRKRPARRP